MERTTWDENRTQATDSSLSQSEAFPPLSLDRSNIARERDVMLPIKGKHMCVLGHFVLTFGPRHLVSPLETSAL